MIEHISIFEDYSSFQPGIEKHVNELNFLKNLLGPQNVHISYDGTIQVKHYVGFFQKGNLRLQVLPKIYYDSVDENNQGEQKDSLKFVFKLLAETDFLKFKNLDVSQFTTEDADLFEILIKIFIDQFHHLFTRNIFSDYISVNDNLPFIKGKIDFPQTLKKNVFAKHLHYLHYDEFTINNPLNQFFKSIILRLLKATKDAANKKKLRLAVAYLQDVEDVLITPRLIQLIYFNRRNATYEPLYNLARLFHYNHTPGLSRGAENTFSFLIPLNELFEDYVGQLLKRFNNKEIKFRHHKKAFSELIFESDNCLYSIYPDFSLSINNSYKAILDAKYKAPLADGSYRIVREDIYQLTTYAMHFGCGVVYLIYPMFKGSVKNEPLIGTFEIKMNSSTVVLKVIQLDLENTTRNEEIIRELVVSNYLELHFDQNNG